MYQLVASGAEFSDSRGGSEGDGRGADQVGILIRRRALAFAPPKRPESSASATAKEDLSHHSKRTDGRTDVGLRRGNRGNAIGIQLVIARETEVKDVSFGVGHVFGWRSTVSSSILLHDGSEPNLVRGFFGFCFPAHFTS